VKWVRQRVLQAHILLPLVDALPELMTPASAALGVPALTEPGEGWAKGGPAYQQSAVFLGVPKGIRAVMQLAEWPEISVAVVA
jgi:hypothetical protein